MGIAHPTNNESPMTNLSKKLLQLPTARLSRKMVLFVFGSIVVIEGILLIPSVLRRENEFKNQLKEVTAGQIRLIKQIDGGRLSGEELLKEIQQIQELEPIPLIGKLRHDVIGGAFYQANGDLIGEFGKSPQLSFTDVNQGHKTSLTKGSQYDAAWTAQEMAGKYVLIISHDATSIKPELYAFILRICGLVLIISLFVTLGVWICLDPLVISPILQLRKDLITAGEAIAQDQAAPEFASSSIQRKDELGDVIAAFDQMFQKISEAVAQRKEAEAALQLSLTQVQEYSEALNMELEKGREMQKNFLPANIMQQEGWEIAAFFQPARQVAGDFYDVFELPGGLVGLVIADVCDKGVGAALFMALFRSLIRIFSGQTILEGLSLPGQELTQKNNYAEKALQAVSLTNNYIAQNHGELGMFATLFFGVLEPETGKLTYINGGHEPLYLIPSSGGVKDKVKSTGSAVGILPNLKFKIGELTLEKGETLLGYTDGVPEARAKDSSFFTQNKLLSIIEANFNTAQLLVDKIATEVINHTGEAEQFDDITLLAIKRL